MLCDFKKFELKSSCIELNKDYIFTDKSLYEILYKLEKVNNFYDFLNNWKNCFEKVFLNKNFDITLFESNYCYLKFLNFEKSLGIYIYNNLIIFRDEKKEFKKQIFFYDMDIFYEFIKFELDIC